VQDVAPFRDVRLEGLLIGYAGLAADDVGEFCEKPFSLRQ
jgi:hypothetical protein